MLRTTLEFSRTNRNKEGLSQIYSRMISLSPIHRCYLFLSYRHENIRWFTAYIRRIEINDQNYARPENTKKDSTHVKVWGIVGEELRI